MTLTEIMVVIAIMLAMVGVMAGGMRSILDLEKHRAARELAMLFEALHDEAMMRNVSFRVRFDLRANQYKVEVGEAGAVIFDNKAEREAYQELVEGRLASMNDEEKAEYRKNRQPFERLVEGFDETYDLPSGVQIRGVYTPQYDDMVMWDPEADEDDVQVVDSYLFATGFTEHTVIWLTDPQDESDGYTIEVEPMSGVVHLDGEVREWDRDFRFVPAQGPSLPN